MPIKRRIAIVGCCGAGKSTVTACLRARGIDAYAIAQEHSIVKELWKRGEPDAVVYLSVDLETIRRRKSNAEWPGWLYEIQIQRLVSARANATVLVDANGWSVDDLVSQIIQALPEE